MNGIISDLYYGNIQPKYPWVRSLNAHNASVSPCVRLFSRQRVETHPAP